MDQFLARWACETKQANHLFQRGDVIHARNIYLMQKAGVIHQLQHFRGSEFDLTCLFDSCHITFDNLAEVYKVLEERIQELKCHMSIAHIYTSIIKSGVMSHNHLERFSQRWPKIQTIYLEKIRNIHPRFIERLRDEVSRSLCNGAHDTKSANIQEE